MNNKSLTIAAITLFVSTVAVVAFLSFNATTVAQTQTGLASRTLSVNGIGAVSATPDVLQANLGVETQNVTLGDALSDNNAQMAALLSELSDLGVAKSDIQTTDFFVSETRDRDGAITGFLVVNNVHVTLRDLSTAGGILDQAVQAGANRISNIQLSISDPEPLLSQARALAVENARSKAKELADAAEMFLGSPITINESGGFQSSVARTAALDAFESAVPLAAGQLTVTVNVSITYEIF